MFNTISKTAVLTYILDLIKLLKGHKSHHTMAMHNDSTLTALDKLQDILNNSNITHHPILKSKT